MKRLVARVMSGVDGVQRRHRAVGMPLAVFKRFGEHQGGRLAAVFSYYSFFSVFPLLLVFVTILGLVLENNPSLRDDLVDGALGQIPVIGSQLADGDHPLQGDVVTLIVGLATALWAGLGAIGALQVAMDELWDVPFFERGSFFVKRVRVVAVIVVIAVGIAASTLLANMATLFDVGGAGAALGLVATGLLDAALLLAVFHLLMSVRVPWRQLLPGALVGGAALLLLNQLGSFVVRRFLAGASDTYGTFAVVIALLSWFFLLGRVLLLSAELNAVLARHLAPRSLTKDGPLTDADRRAVLLDAQRVQRDRRIGVATSIDGQVDGGPVVPTPPDGDPAPAAGSAGDVEVSGEPADLEQPLDRSAR